MAREVVIGLVVRARDEATPPLERAEKSAKKAEGSFDRFAKTTTGALKGLKFMQGLQAFNAGMEILNRVTGYARATLGAWIETSLKSRAASDASRQAIDSTSKSVDRLGLALGDALVPLLAGAARAAKPLIEQFTKWVDANRDLVGSKIKDWLRNVGVLIVGLASAAETAVYALVGLKQLANGADVAANELEILHLKGLRGQNALAAAALRASGVFSDRAAEYEAAVARIDAQLVKLEGNQGELAGKVLGTERAMDSAIGVIRSLSDAFQDLTESSSTAGGAVARVGEELGLYDSKYQGYLKTVFQEEIHAKVLAKLRSEAAAAVQRDAAQLQRTAELRSAAYDRAAADAVNYAAQLEAERTQVGGLAGAWQDYARERGRRSEWAAGNTKGAVNFAEAQAAKKLLLELRSTADGIAESLTSSIMSAARSVYSGSKTVLEAFGDLLGSIGESIVEFFVGLGVKWVLGKVITAIVGRATEAAAAVTAATIEIQAYKAVAKAGAIAAYSAIPFAGLPLGLAAAAANGAAIDALALLPMAEGGMVRGGTPGRDSVPILAMPGELVLPVPIARWFAGALGQPAASRPAEEPRRAQSRDQPTRFIPVPETEYMRWLRSSDAPARRKLARLGLRV